MDFHQKKQKKVEQGSPNSNEEGDAWIYACIKRNSYLFIAYSIGKWRKETCREMIDKAFMRIELPFPNNKIQVFSDGGVNMAKSIIIIGAGMAGMSAGCYGRMNGYNTRIFEMHNIPGGLCTSWQRGMQRLLT